MVCELLNQNPCHLRITPPRKTKLGDFRPSLEGGLHHITVNGDLNCYAFLITLVHEIAHLQVWDRYKRKVKPHGTEWKATFSEQLQPFVSAQIFPENVTQALSRYIANPKASSCSDVNLMRQLSYYDNKEKMVDEKLEIGDPFVFRGKEFVRGQKRRTRYECSLRRGSKVFLFHAMTPVEAVENHIEK